MCMCLLTHSLLHAFPAQCRIDERWVTLSVKSHLFRCLALALCTSTSEGKLVGDRTANVRDGTRQNRQSESQRPRPSATEPPIGLLGLLGFLTSVSYEEDSLGAWG